MPASLSLNPRTMRLRGLRIACPRPDIPPIPEPERSQLLEFARRGFREFKEQNARSHVGNDAWCFHDAHCEVVNENSFRP